MRHLELAETVLGHDDDGLVGVGGEGGLSDAGNAVDQDTWGLQGGRRRSEAREMAIRVFLQWEVGSDRVRMVGEPNVEPVRSRPAASRVSSGNEFEALLARAHGARRFEGLADVGGPGGELALGDAKAHLDIVAGVLAVGLDALDELREFVLVPLDLLRKIGNDCDAVVLEADGSAVLLGLGACLAGAVAVAKGERAIEPGDKRLGLAGSRLAPPSAGERVRMQAELAICWTVSLGEVGRDDDVGGGRQPRPGGLVMRTEGIIGQFFPVRRGGLSGR